MCWCSCRDVAGVSYPSTLYNIVHHVWSYLMMYKEGHISFGEPVDVCAPADQFTNLLGAYYAKVSNIYIHVIFNL